MSDTNTTEVTSAEYVKLGGCCCPFCLSTDISGGPVTVDGPVASQEVSCNECDAEWADDYQLTGFTPS